MFSAVFIRISSTIIVDSKTEFTETGSVCIQNYFLSNGIYVIAKGDQWQIIYLQKANGQIAFLSFSEDECWRH